MNNSALPLRRAMVLGAPLALAGISSACSGPTPATPAAPARWTGKPAFSIVDIQVHDGKRFGEYVAGHAATIAAAGGRFLVAGAAGELIEGERRPHTMVIHQWPDAQTFLGWYDGPAYAPWKPIRHAAAMADVVLVQGVSDSAPAPMLSPAFTLVDIEVRDPQVFGRYVQGHMPSLLAAGGQFLCAGGHFQVIEGEWRPRRVILHRWPNVDAFRNWYASDAYRPWRELRQSVSSANVTLVAGLSDVQKSQRKLP